MASLSKALFVYNPKSGKARIRTKLFEIIDIFAKAGYEMTLRPTMGPGDAAEIVKGKEDRYELVVCSGGDGTLDEVVHGMLQCEKPLPIGYIPAGSTNDFARSLGIPREMEKAAEVITKGERFRCDIGMLGDKPFVYVAAFGMFTEVSYETNQDFKNLLGHAAYILEGMTKLTNIKVYPMAIKCDEKTISGDFLIGMITNTTSVGGIINLEAEQVDLSDGLFEVTLISLPKNALEWNQLLAAMVDRNIKSDHLHIFKTRHIEFASKEPVAWTTDGEFGGEYTEVIIENKNKAIEVIVPTKQMRETLLQWLTEFSKQLI